MSNPLAGLIKPPLGPKPWKLRDGAVVTSSPLTVLLDGDDDAVTPTKSPLIGGIAIGQRVMVMFADKQLIVLGAYAPDPILDAVIHLDNVKTTGPYHQEKNADASTARGYPVALAGLLEVVDAPRVGGTRFVYQRYTVYNGGSVYSRVYYGFSDTWSAWLPLHT